MTYQTSGKTIRRWALAGASFAALSPSLALAQTQTAPASSPSTQAGTTLEEVVVTARRREESIQKTPVSVSAFSGKALREAGASNIQEITSLVPGINLTGSGAPTNTVFVIRGLSRGVVGEGQSAVVSYLDEVPLSVWATSLPTYDMTSVQVLKGPQGTLFGRNATAGAVLATTAPPTDRFGGYFDGTLGSYNWHTFEGAINLPLVADMVDLRLSGKIDRRDGYTKNMNFPGHDFDDLNGDDFRASLLVKPTAALSNTTVLEYEYDHTNGNSVIPVAYFPGGFADLLPWTNGSVLNPLTGTPCNNQPICSVKAVVARQMAAGPREAWSDFLTPQTTRIEGVINTTRYDFGDLGFTTLAFKNIVSYRAVYENLLGNGDGSEMSMINTNPVVSNRTITEEVQFSGASLGGKLNWIAGFFYSDFAPNGGQRLAIQALAVPGTSIFAPQATAFGPANNSFFSGASGTSDYYYEKSKAGYVHTTYDLGAFLKGLKVDAGLRYTEDQQRVCDLAGQAESNPIIGPSACPTTPGANVVSGYRDSKITWNAGLDYQITSDILAYFTTRTGFRMGGINTPVFVGTLIPFQRYAPETVQDYEVGLKSNFHVNDMRGHFDVAVYESDLSNLQAAIPSGGSPCPDGVCNPVHFPSNQTFYGNVGDATVKGVETEASISPIRGLELSVGAAWVDPQITSLSISLPSTLAASAVTKAAVASYAFLGSPDFSWTGELHYALPLDSHIGQVSFDARYFNISHFSFGSITGGGYSTVNFRLDWNGIYNNPIDASFFVNNATDAVGIVGGSLTSPGIGLSTGMYNEPRMFGFQFRYHFGSE